MEKAANSFIDRLASQRAWISIALGAFLAAKSTSIFIFDIGETGMRVSLANGLSAVAWLAWLLIVMLFALFAGGLWLSKSLRARLNDEGTVANWRAALGLGFWAMMVGAVISMIASRAMPLTGPAVVQVMVSLGIGMALMRFGALERRALTE